jgi:hypothetical protein
VKTLITWKPGKYSIEQGSAGGVHLFTVAWKTLQSKPDWNMRTKLPDMRGYAWESDSKDELRAIAEGTLAGWLARVQGER